MKCKTCGDEKMDLVADFCGPEVHYVQCVGCKKKGPVGKDPATALEKWEEINKIGKKHDN